MPDRPYTLVDAVRACCDAILVGPATVRNDNPRLLVRSKTRRDARTARGFPPAPIKVTGLRYAFGRGETVRSVRRGCCARSGEQDQQRSLA